MGSIELTTEILDMGPAVAVELTEQILDSLGGKRVPVTVTINDFTFRTTTATMGGRRLVGLSKANKTAAGVEAGDQVRVTIANDAKRVVEVPPDLAEALARAPEAAAAWKGLAYTHQHEYAEWITGAKRDETRQRRVGQAIERLASGSKTPRG